MLCSNKPPSQGIQKLEIPNIFWCNKYYSDSRFKCNEKLIMPGTSASKNSSTSIMVSWWIDAIMCISIYPFWSVIPSASDTFFGGTSIMPFRIHSDPSTHVMQFLAAHLPCHQIFHLSYHIYSLLLTTDSCVTDLSSNLWSMQCATWWQFSLSLVAYLLSPTKLWPSHQVCTSAMTGINNIVVQVFSFSLDKLLGADIHRFVLDPFLYYDQQILWTSGNFSSCTDMDLFFSQLQSASQTCTASDIAEVKKKQSLLMYSCLTCKTDTAIT